MFEGQATIELSARLCIVGLICVALWPGCKFGERPSIVANDYSHAFNEADDATNSDVSNSATSSSGANAHTCAFGADRVALTRVPAELPETSGIATSSFDPQTWWLHNDSGGEAVVYGVREGDGRPFVTVSLQGAEAIDWEDITVGPCDNGTERSCIYIADFGDNEARRDSVSFYRVPEPTEIRGERQATNWERMEATYPEGPTNAEALFYAEGRLWILSKREAGFEIYSHTFESDERVVLDRVGTVELDEVFENPQYAVDTVTAADWSPERSALVVRTYGWIYVFGWSTDEPTDILEVLADPSFVLRPGAEFQGESVAWNPRGIVHVSEGHRTPIWLLPCSFSQREIRESSREKAAAAAQ
jgi:hypothetical protein